VTAAFAEVQSHVALGFQAAQRGDSEEAAREWDLAVALSRQFGPKAEVETMVDVADGYLQLGGSDRAVPILRSAAARASELEDPAVEAPVLDELARCLYDVGATAEADVYADWCLTRARQAEDPVVLGIVAGNLANRSLHAGLPEQALSYYEEAARAYAQAGDRGWRSRILTSWGCALDALGRYADARALHEEAAELARAESDQEWAGTCLDNLASSWGAAGNYEKAIELRRQAMAAAQQAMAVELLRRVLDNLTIDLKHVSWQPRAEAELLGELGRLAFSVGDAETAAATFQDALEKLDPQLESRRYAEILEALADARGAAGDTVGAVAARRALLQRVRELGDDEWRAKTLGNLGVALLEAGELTEAAPLFEEQVAIALHVNSPENRAAGLGNLGVLCYKVGNYALALRYLRTQREIAETGGLDLLTASAALMLGAVHLTLGQTRAAGAWLERAVAEYRTLNDVLGLARALNNAGIASMKRGDYELAVSQFDEALTLADSHDLGSVQSEVLNNQGILLTRRGDTVAAVQLYAALRASARHHEDTRSEAHAVSNLALAYEDCGDLDAAHHFLEDALELARQAHDRQLEIRVSNQLGAVLLKMSDATGAEEVLRGVVALEMQVGSRLEDAPSVALFSTQESTFPLLVEALLEQGRTDEGLEIWELGRARALAAVMRRRRAPDRQIRSYVAAIQNVVYDLLLREGTHEGKPLIGRAMLNQLLRRTSLPGTDTPPAEPLTAQGLRQVAKEYRTAFVFYAPLLGNKLSIWVVDEHSIHHRTSVLGEHDRNDPSELHALVERLRASLGASALPLGTPPTASDTAPAAQADILRRLYDLLIGPVADVLPKAKAARLCIVPADELYLVPFAALLDEHGSALIDRFALFSVPSVSVLALTRRERPSEPPASSASLVVGNPKASVSLEEYGDVRLAPLTYAGVEAEYVGAVLGAKPLVGTAADKRVVVQRMPNAPVVHLATHALLNDADPLASAIALSPSMSDRQPPDAADDGLLTARELDGIDLQAELVVLSACNTGVGAISGDGVAGLSRSLVAAGASSIIVSLWPVSDSATADLMASFYTAWKQDQAAALRTAMRQTRKTHPDARLWAGFTLIGQPARPA